jgi:type I restriction enzyme S subunit
MELIAEKYKKTEVGLIPEDWEVKSIKDILKIIGGGTFKSHDAQNVGIRWLKIANVGKNKIIWNEENFLPEVFKNEYRNFLLESGDYVLALTRPIIDRELKIARLKPNDAPCLLNQRVGKIVNSEICDINYIYFLLQEHNIISSLLQSMAGSDPPNLNIKAVNAILCCVPPTKAEQTAIATALSDADGLISSLEKLIAKKKAIKQGAMQQLLKPKPGWVEKKLGLLGKPYGGLSGKSKTDFTNGKYPYIPFMNIMSNPIIDTSYLAYVNIKGGESQNKALKGDLFFNGSSETPEEVGMCSILLKDLPTLYLNSFCFGFRLNDPQNNNGLYLSYFFRSSEGRKLFYSMAQGATRYNLSKSNFNKIEISFPKPDKQIEIAAILYDMDKNIDSLEQKLSKAKQIKQGMMQTLLTGKIRLV